MSQSKLRRPNLRTVLMSEERAKKSMTRDVDLYIRLVIRLEANNSSAHLFQLRKPRNCTEIST